MRINLSDLPPAMRRQVQQEYDIKGEGKSKYHSQKCEIDGIVFDSRKEAKRYRELQFLQRAGEIKDLRRQAAFTLHKPSVTKVNGKNVKRRGMVYKADFVYWDNAADCEVIEDVKGYRTKVYKQKKRLMKQIYGIAIKEV